MLSPTKSPSLNYFQVSQQYNSEPLNNQFMESSKDYRLGSCDPSTPQPSGIFTHTPSKNHTPNVYQPSSSKDQSFSPILNFSPDLNFSPFPSPTLPQTNLNQCFYSLTDQSHFCPNFQFPTQNCCTDQPDIFKSSTDNQFNSIVNFLNFNPNQQIYNLLTRIQNIQKTIDQYEQRTNLSSSYQNYIFTLTELQNQFKSQLQSALLFHIQNQVFSPSLQHPQKNHTKDLPLGPHSPNPLSTNISNLQQRLSIINKKQTTSKNKYNIVQSALQQQLQLLLQLQHDQKQ